MDANEIEVYVPNGVEDPRIAETRKLIQEYAAERVAAIEADAAAVDATNFKAHKLNAFDADKDALSDKAKAISALVAEKTGVAALLVQLKASENEIGAAIKARQAVIREVKAANTPAEPTHSYVVQMDVTDADFKKVVALLAKTGAAYRYVGVDNKDGKADKFFAANGWKEPEAAAK